MRCSVVQCRWDGIVYDGGVYDTGSICRAGGVQSSESFPGAGVSSGCDDDGVRVDLEASWRGNGELGQQPHDSPFALGREIT